MRTNPTLRRQTRYIDPAQLQRGREHHEALRAQSECDQNQARWKADQMAKRDRSPMNFNRTNTKAAEAGLTAYGELNQKLDEALGEVAEAMKRGRLADATSGATDDDLKRSAALRARKGGA